MLKIIDKFLSIQTSPRILIFSFLLVALIGALDEVTGYEMSFSIFYLIPVALVSWYTSDRSAHLLICIVSAVTWLYVDIISGHTHSHSLMPVWNTGVRLGFYIIVSSLLLQLHKSLVLQASLAELDGLTGIMNARAFRQQCQSCFELSSRHNQALAIGYLDIDGFKGINDKKGHAIGDAVLKAVACRLSERLRSSDICARLGGDEFVALLPQTDIDGAKIFFVELHKNLLQLAEINHWPIGFSIGVAVFTIPPKSPDDAIRFADQLMYQVKHAGKNRIMFEEYRN